MANHTIDSGNGNGSLSSCQLAAPKTLGAAYSETHSKIYIFPVPLGLLACT